ncbi:MAG: TlpA family protein disulfide reductase [Sedimentisphaerales bacterium]|nr:TlpA family protein disulfide reductase [Sedimentisphaerales bacterium]
MAIWNRNTIYYWVTSLVLAFMVGLGALNGCRKQPAAPAKTESSKASPAASTQPVDASKDPIQAAKSLSGDSKASLQKAIEEAKTWEPAFEQWQGKIAPDITLTDINGNVHKLSNYRGKDVLVVFWATWCGPCKLEAPELIELRKSVSQDKLVMLAISREDPALLKSFAAQNQLNYTVLSCAGTTLPSPYGDVRNIPSAFFVDPEGKIKLATMGMLPRADINKILDAK